MNFHLLGQVMIDKNPGITSAVNKTSNIDNTYRNFQMEVLSGEENMLTKVPCCFPNPKLTENRRSESRQRMFICPGLRCCARRNNCAPGLEGIPLNPTLLSR